jgi:hypothetical protein
VRFWGLLLAGVLGCASRGQQVRDPFLPPSNRGVAPPPGFPVRNTGPLDSARDVSTSPVTDPQIAGGAPRSLQTPGIGLGPVAGANPGVLEQPAAAEAKPATAQAPAATASQAARPTELTPEAQAANTAQLQQSIRRRLDLAGARDLRLETDPVSGKHKFSCEVPHPGNPELARVFFAVHDDWTKAMLAVADAVENWVANQKQK